MTANNISEKLERLEQKNQTLVDSLILLKEQVAELSKNKPSNLIVFNDSSKEKIFHYMNIVEGKGIGLPIRPFTFREFYLDKGAYKWYYHNRKSNINTIDTLQKGDAVYGNPDWKKVIVMN
ncbi:cell division protein ZapB [Aquimarina sp. ERC-38]|uniref:hypothetical protein n=1 Tax=Aquimarina sp. ERC-38 TaxID=2949996 RepID=UPI002245E5B2|nr:hypothetical protein [Aquimarina sp. ERC-38]UZO80646.1 cell division protein ZapB [Aquimarina sp. ERC-38]